MCAAAAILTPPTPLVCVAGFVGDTAVPVDHDTGLPVPAQQSLLDDPAKEDRYLSLALPLALRPVVECCRAAARSRLLVCPVLLTRWSSS